MRRQIWTTLLALQGYQKGAVVLSSGVGMSGLQGLG